MPNSTLTLTIQESATCLLYMGCLREGEDDEDDDDEDVDEVGEGLSGFRADISACTHLRKELGGVREEVGVSTEMS